MGNSGVDEHPASVSITTDRAYRTYFFLPLRASMISTAFSTFEEFAFFTPAAKPQARPMARQMRARIMLLGCTLLLNGQPFQPPVHPAYLLKAGIVLDGVSHTADNHYIARHIALFRVNSIKTRGVWVGDVVLPCLVGYAHNWAFLTDDDIPLLYCKWDASLSSPLTGER